MSNLNLTWSFSQTFSTKFQTARFDLESRIDVIKTSSPVSQTALQELSAEVAKLAKSLADATGSLPSYDQRQYELQVSGLETMLAELRTASVPKAKFAFKRKAPVVSSPPIAVASSIPEATSASIPHQTSITSNLVLSSRSYEYVTLQSLAYSSLQQDLTISDLDHCIVNLIPLATGGAVREDGPKAHGPTASLDISAIHVRNLTDTVLLLPPINGSVLLHDLARCTLVLGCHQFRMHNSNNVDVFLAIPSNPIIEHSSDVRFSGYPKFLSPSLDENLSKHLSVQDFSHIRSTPSPHWSVLSDGDERIAHLPLEPVTDRVEISDTLKKLLPKYT